jgi:hypothetical protein
MSPYSAAINADRPKLARMSAPPLKKPMPDFDSPAADRPTESARTAALRAANINPKNGLATDYLNHFNEAIMLLEMIPAMPECAGDFLSWQPLTYAEHFVASNFKGRDLAVAAYNEARDDVRVPFDEICDTMTSILMAIRDAVETSNQDVTKMRLAENAVGWLKPLVAKAGGIINGISGSEADDAQPQSDVDLIMSN